MIKLAGALTRKYVELMGEFQEVQSTYKKHLRDRVARQVCTVFLIVFESFCRAERSLRKSGHVTRKGTHAHQVCSIYHPCAVDL